MLNTQVTQEVLEEYASIYNLLFERSKKLIDYLKLDIDVNGVLYLQDEGLVHVSGVDSFGQIKMRDFPEKWYHCLDKAIEGIVDQDQKEERERIQELRTEEYRNSLKNQQGE